MKHESNYYWFDFLRGTSAVIVLMGHIRALTFITFSGSVQAIDIWGKLFYFLTGFSHQAVIIFFVLSGFFIIQSIHKSILKNSWSVKLYAVNRLSRLWVVLLPALLFTLLWDKIGLSVFGSVLPYSGAMDNIPGIYPLSQLGLSTFLGNLFFLQTIFVHTFGSNVALWSLANEFWYYLLFPLFYFSFFKHYKPVVRIGSFILAVALSFMVGRGIMMYFPIWLMGGLTYLLIKKGDIGWLRNNLTFFLLLIIFAVELVGGRLNLYPLVCNDYFMALTLVLLLYNLSFKKMENLKLKNVITNLSNVSYSVYLTHVSFAALVSAFFFRQKIEWSYGGFLYYLLMCAIVFVYCLLMFYLFERNTRQVKKKISEIIKI